MCIHRDRSRPARAGESCLRSVRLVRVLPPASACWAVTFIPMPMPKRVCRTYYETKWVQYEVCRTLFGRGVGMNITAHLPTNKQST